MAWERWGLGVMVIAAATLPAFACAPYLRRRLVPGWSGPPARLADAVVALAAIVLMAQLLGTLGLLRPGGLVAGGLLAGLALRLGGRPRGTAARGEAGLGGRGEIAIAAVALTALLAQALASVVHRGARGMLDPDSIHYHLTFAARFARSGSTTGIAYVSPGDNAPYHPATAELLHALGLVAWRVEVLTLVLNLGALVLAVLAAAVLGGARGRGAAAVTAVAAVLALPMLGRDQAGGPLNDVVAIAFLLAGVALAVHALRGERPSAGGLVLTGAALGLAVGTKLTTLAPVGLVALAVAVHAGSVRAGAWRLGRLVPAALLTGGYWFARNLLHVGNPLPAVDFGLMPRPPMPVLDSVDQAVLDYLGDADVVRETLLPGLQTAIGPGLPLVALLLAVAAAGALVVAPRDRLRQMLAGGMLVAVLIYLSTPTTAGGQEGDLTLFRFNVRYAGPALCVLAGLSALWLRDGRWGLWWSGAWLAALLATLLRGARAWADPDERLAATGAAVAIVLLVAGTVLLARRLPVRARPPAAGAVALLAVLAAGAGADRYVSDWRYAAPETDRDRIVALGRDIEAGRTGVSGFPLQFSFFGPRLDADAEYVAEITGEDEVRDPPTCLAWRRALRAGGYDRVVILRAGSRPLPPTAEWTSSIPGIETILANRAGVAYALASAAPDAGC